MNKGGIQLLPESKKKIDVRVVGENRVLMTGVFILVLILGAYGGLRFYISGLESRVNELNQELADIENERDTEMEKNLVGVSKQVATITDLFQSHISMSRTFERLEAVFAPDVIFTSIKIETKNEKITGKIITTSFVSVAKQLSAFLADDGIEDYSIGKITPQNDGTLEASIELKVKRDVYFK